jgi:hypothetical protein
MLLTSTEVKARSLEHNLRVDKINRDGWMFPSPQHQRGANALATIVRVASARLSGLGSYVGLNGHPRKGSARSAA